MTDNIIQFPTDKIIRKDLESELKIENIKLKGMQNFADHIVDELSDNILLELNHYGLNLDACHDDLIFSLIVMRAAVYRSLGLEHDAHAFLDENVEIFQPKMELNEAANNNVEMSELDDIN